jgi:hypothetical protein
MTHAHLTHTGADFEHFSGNLMTEHQGFADFKVQDSAFVVIAQVRSADSSSTEAYQDLAVLRARRLSVDSQFLSSLAPWMTQAIIMGRGLDWRRNCQSQRLGRLPKMLCHLVSNVIRLANRECDDCQGRILCRAGCELAAVRYE